MFQGYAMELDRGRTRFAVGKPELGLQPPIADVSKIRRQIKIQVADPSNFKNLITQYRQASLECDALGLQPMQQLFVRQALCPIEG